MLVLEHVMQGNDADEVRSALKSKFSYLNMDYFGEKPSKVDFSEATKSETFIKTALEGAPACPICGGYVHTKSISVDHIERKEDGGSGDPSNAQITHPYCNSTYKN